MTKRMLIDAAHAEETRVVVVDGTRVEEFDFESQAKKQLRGNIYLAKVTRVEPSLQAAFIEYGGNRHGFLAFNEIHPDYYHIPLADKEALLREEAEEEEAHAKSGRASAPRELDADDDGEVDDDDDDDVIEEELERRRRRLMRRYKIQEVIKRRQIMLVQVVKEERGNKGAALTTYLSLAGRYCVLMPNTARGGGISRKITTVTDRRRLKTLVQSLDVPQGMGLIVRTAGAKRTKAEIKRDYEYLERLWENIREVTMSSIAPALIYEEEDLVKRAIRDMYDKDLDGIIVEGEEGYRSAKEFMRMLMPSQAKKIQAYREPTPLFIKARVEEHLAQIYNPTVPLRSGGYIVINQTEALVAIDVNSGRATRERNIEATALKTNCEAAEEAARQLRLRDLAGLIVIDFIDMDEGKNNRTVEKVLKDALKDDRARIQMGKISSFGLMELSRQRRRSGVLEGTTHVCEHCEGTGRVRAVESSALSALRSVEMEAVRQGPGEIALKAPRAVGLYILNHKRAYLLRLLQTQGLQVTVILDDTLSNAEHAIERLSTLTEEERAALAAASPAFVPAYEPPEDDYVDEDEDEDEEDEEAIEREDTDDDEPPVFGKAEGERPAGGREDGEQRRGRRRRRRGGRREEGSDEPRLAASEDDAPEAGGEDDELDRNGSRRRRRGRRGGRRMREESRPQDVYAWSRVRVPHTDGVYGWFDPSTPPPAPAPAPSPAAVPARAQAASTYDFVEPEAPRSLSPAAAGPDVDIWVELPEASEPPAKPGRPRRSRSRKPAGAPVETAAPAVAEAPPEPTPAVAEAEPDVAPAEVVAPVKAPRKRKPSAKALAAEAAAAEAASAAPAAVVEEAPAPAPTPKPVPAPVLVQAEATAEPDPAEIAAPPAQPRRGWWRR